MTKTLLLLPGDGIGPEVCAEAARVAQWLRSNASLDVQILELPFGGASFDNYGQPLSAQARDAALQADAVLMGAVGGHKWNDVSREKRPEAGLLELRTAMGVYANLRPAFCFDPLVDASSLKRDVVAGLDLMIVRELTGGIYFGRPQGIEQRADGSERAIDTQVYTTEEIERVARVAFRLARGRRNEVTSVEKSNVMMSGVLWRRVVTRVRDQEFPEVKLQHMYADNCAMQLVRNPKQFDVLVTDNLFGDILSDAAAMLTGSLGMLPSAALGEAGRPGLYEPVHGSAPDIAGAGIANPLAAILSLQMALRWSLGRPDLADCLFEAVSAALARGARTRDLGGKLSTADMGSAVIATLAAN
jgi:3-isopropylmalate dehydrogenase